MSNSDELDHVNYAEASKALSFIKWNWVFIGRVALRRVNTVWVEYEGFKDREILKVEGFTPVQNSIDRNGHYRFDVAAHRHLAKARILDWVIVYSGFLNVPIPGRNLRMPLVRAALLGVTTDVFLGEKTLRCPECSYTMIFGPIPTSLRPDFLVRDHPVWYHSYLANNPYDPSKPYRCSIDAAQRSLLVV